jgi:hypothetical protein
MADIQLPRLSARGEIRNSWDDLRIQSSKKLWMTNYFEEKIASSRQ